MPGLPQWPPSKPQSCHYWSRKGSSKWNAEAGRVGAGEMLGRDGTTQTGAEAVLGGVGPDTRSTQQEVADLVRAAHKVQSEGSPRPPSGRGRSGSII